MKVTMHRDEILAYLWQHVMEHYNLADLSGITVKELVTYPRIFRHYSFTVNTVALRIFDTSMRFHVCYDEEKQILYVGYLPTDAGDSYPYMLLSEVPCQFETDVEAIIGRKT